MDSVRHINLICRECNGEGPRSCHLCGGTGFEQWPVCPVCEDVLHAVKGREIAYANGTPALHRCANGHTFERYAERPSYVSRYVRVEEMAVAS